MEVDEYEEEDELRNAIGEELGIKPIKKKTSKAKTKPTANEPHSTEKKSKTTKCPHGYKFGVDTDENDECDDCPLWDACIDKKEE